MPAKIQFKMVKMVEIGPESAVQVEARGCLRGECVEPGFGVGVEPLRVHLDAVRQQLPVDLKAENGRKNVKPAPNRPISSANRRRQRLVHVYAHVNPAQ